jgi:hypothetical protein
MNSPVRLFLHTNGLGTASHENDSPGTNDERYQTLQNDLPNKQTKKFLRFLQKKTTSTESARIHPMEGRDSRGQNREGALGLPKKKEKNRKIQCFACFFFFRNYGGTYIGVQNMLNGGVQSFQRRTTLFQHFPFRFFPSVVALSPLLAGKNPPSPKVPNL